MPYIEKSVRSRAWYEPRTPGELNYALTMLCVGYVMEKGLSYTFINDCVGALEGAKLELYRRVASPYEDKKIAENGDVYPLDLTQSMRQRTGRVVRDSASKTQERQANTGIETVAESERRAEVETQATAVDLNGITRVFDSTSKKWRLVKWDPETLTWRTVT